MARFVALGDSLTEGAGDPYPGAPNGLRGWADLVAAELAAVDPFSEYANLALRGRRARDVLREQVPRALALEPSLVSLWAGGNDLLRPTTDVDEVERTVDEAVARLAASGARVVLLTCFELTPSPLLRLAAGRVARLNDRLRLVAARHGADVVEVADFPRWAGPPVLCHDRVHPSPHGHRLIADRVSATLGLPVAGALTGASRPEAPRAAPGWVDEGRWWCLEVVPHLVRWATDASSSDGATAKLATPVRVAELAARA